MTRYTSSWKRPLYRCVACGDQVNEYQMRVIARGAGAGTVTLCHDCWYDVLQAVRSGAHELDGLLALLQAVQRIWG